MESSARGRCVLAGMLSSHTHRPSPTAQHPPLLTHRQVRARLELVKAVREGFKSNGQVGRAHDDMSGSDWVLRHRRRLRMRRLAREANESATRLTKLAVESGHVMGQVIYINTISREQPACPTCHHECFR